MIRPKFKRFWSKKKGSVAIAVGVWFVISAVQWLGWFQGLEWAALDRLFQARPLESPDERIIIVGITEADIRKYQKYPFSDDILAELLEKIKAQQPRVIGLDLFRDVPVAPGGDRLETIFKTTSNLIGIGSAEGDKDDTYFTKVDFPPVLYELSKKNNFELNKIQVSDVGLFVDDDGVVRRGIVFPSKDLESLGFNIPSLGAAVAFRYLNIEPSVSQNRGWMRLGKTVFHAFHSNDGGYVRAVDTGFQMIINWRGPAESFKHVSVAEVMEGKIAPTLLSDRIVLIGAMAPTLSLDAHNTPFSEGQGETPKPTYGVEIQANIASQIISSAVNGRKLIHTWNDFYKNAWLILWIVSSILMVQKLANIKKPLALISWCFFEGAFLTGFIVLATYFFFVSSWWVPSGAVVVAFWLVLIFGVIEELIEQKLQEQQKFIVQLEREKERITQKFEESQLKIKEQEKQLQAQERLVLIGELVDGLNHQIHTVFSVVNINIQGIIPLQNQSEFLLTKINDIQNKSTLDKIKKMISKISKNLENIKNISQRGISLMNKLLPENLFLTLQLDESYKEPIKINELVQENVDFFLNDKEVETTMLDLQLIKDYDLDLDLEIIEGISAQLNIVIITLLNNAWDALLKKRQQKEYRPILYVITKKLTKKIQIIIQDNGIGLNSNIESKLFKGFATTKKSDGGTGLGLGLYLAKNMIVARYKGNLYYRRVETEETQFVVEIPIHE